MYRQTHERRILITAFNHLVIGVDRESGSILWEQKIDNASGVVELAIVDEIVIACTMTALAFLHYHTGELIQKQMLETKYHTARPTMIVDDHQVFVTSNGEVGCYDMQGQQLWSQPFKGKGFSHNIAMGLPGQIRQADHL